MQLTAVDTSRLRSAARALSTHGVRTPAITEATRRQEWPPLLQAQLLVDVHHHAPTASQIGVDVALLPPKPSTQLQPGTIGEPSAADTPLPEMPTATPDTILAPTGDPFHFDGLLDSLRGVGLDELDTVGEKQRTNLAKAGITSVWDLMMQIPLRYLDRSELTPVSELTAGMTKTTFVARVVSKRISHGRTSYVRYTVGDGNITVSCMFFRAMWMANRFKQGDVVLVHGDVTDFKGMLSMSHPIIEKLDDTTAPMLAVYPQSDKHNVSTWMVQRAALEALRRLPDLTDPIPAPILTARDLLGRLDALQAIHVPQNAAAATRGRQRIVYDEFLRLQLSLGVIAHARSLEAGITHTPTGKLVQEWQSQLPYALTGAQQRAITEIRGDMTRPAPMNRLLQGDVGAGKTAVLIATALMAIESGHQAAIIAPSEILARQHFEEIRAALTPLGLNTDLLVSKHLPRKRRDVLTDLANGTCHLAVGTHSLLQDTVTYHDLGVVIIDEQHRFGVDQRAALTAAGRDGRTPDMLQATATPIPRTSAITVFGDMEVSILDEKPPGRSPIDTTWIPTAPTDDPSNTVWATVHDQVRRGRQAFVVCPLVTTSAGVASETKMAASAEATAEELSAGALAGCRIGVVHGKLKPAERSETMAAFAAGELDVLVATTVIEVGVSVPNATAMVVLDASKFGLAQLHQLRGRVGRGRHAGQCWLVGEAVGDGAERMKAMCSTTDGFELSSLDLEIRGPGSLVSTAQAGKDSGLVVANLIEDEDIHLAARDDARTLLAKDPTLNRHHSLRAEVRTALGDQAEYLLRS